MNEETNDKKQKYNTYLKYSGIAFQMASLVFLGLIGGQWLDARFALKTPIFTMLLILLFFSGFMYKLYKDLNKDN